MSADNDNVKKELHWLSIGLIVFCLIVVICSILESKPIKISPLGTEHNNTPLAQGDK